MRRLGKYVKSSGVEAGGHNEFTRTFGSTLHEHGRFHFTKTAFVHEVAQALDELVAEHEVVLHALFAQIEVAVLEAELFVHFLILVDFKRRSFGFVQNLADGRVEAVFEGEKDKIEKIVAWMKKGPFLAKVSEIEIGWEEHNNEFTTFS